MAFSDYKYVGYEDEFMITELILSNLSAICRARKDRVKWLEDLALSIGHDTTAVSVDGTRTLTKNEKYIEQIECDKVIEWLFRIETRVMYKIKCLPKQERDVIRECYLVPGVHTNISAGMKLGISPNYVSTIKKRALNKLTGVCVGVYKDFCNWRAHDSVDLKRRLKSDKETIINKLKKKKELRES